MTEPKFYLTTPLYYVNAEPHIGHSYTNIAADTLARYRRMKGYEVYFLTGTDEHGQKIEKASKQQGFEDVKAFCDKIVEKFTDLWGLLNISYDDFIRTTEFRHEETVKKILAYLYDNGEVYLAEYEGWYCTPCETFWTPGQVNDNKCPDCGRPLEYISEKNYFLRISNYQEWLINYLRDNPDFILPRTRYNEIFSFLKDNELNDLCISRPRERLNWGIPTPFSQDHVTYVWFDALLNYITAPGFLREEERFQKLWPADVHFIGKDILRYHAVYWPIMLHMLGLEPPRMIFAHGWWLVEKEGGEADKMSKSKGNIVDPRVIVEKYSADALRFFLLREVPFGLDGTFSERNFVHRINSDLANDFGNLVYRTLNMIAKYYGGRIPDSIRGRESGDAVFKEVILGLEERIENAMLVLNFQQAIVEIWELIRRANKYIEEKAPWNLFKQDKEKLDYVIYNLAEVLRIVLIALAPFLPDSTSKAWGYLGFKDDIHTQNYSHISRWGVIPPGQITAKGEPLFPRIQE